jgi:hypothetical protein
MIRGSVAPSPGGGADADRRRSTWATASGERGQVLMIAALLPPVLRLTGGPHRHLFRQPALPGAPPMGGVAAGQELPNSAAAEATARGTANTASTTGM